MPLKHLLILLFIAIAHGSAFPVTKLVLNDSVPPILMASLRMGLVLLLLIPFWKWRGITTTYNTIGVFDLIKLGLNGLLGETIFFYLLTTP